MGRHKHVVTSNNFPPPIVNRGVNNCAICYSSNFIFKKWSKMTKTLMYTHRHPPQSHEVWKGVNYSVFRYFYSIPKRFRVTELFDVWRHFSWSSGNDWGFQHSSFLFGCEGPKVGLLFSSFKSLFRKLSFLSMVGHGLRAKWLPLKSEMGTKVSTTFTSLFSKSFQASCTLFTLFNQPTRPNFLRVTEL